MLAVYVLLLSLKVNQITMNNKMRNLLRVLAVLLVLLAVLMQLDIIWVRQLSEMKFWMVVIGFGLMLISSR